MRFRKITLALVACLALGALAASTAQAGWTIGATENQTTAGTLIPNGTHERVSCKRHGTSAMTLTSSVLGAHVEMTVDAIDCLEKAGSTNAATIDNTTSTGHSEGVLTFTNVKVTTPVKCHVVGTEITSTPLTDEIIMDPTAGSTVVFDRFFSHDGHLFTIEFDDPECILAGASVPVKGTLCGESVHTNAGGTGYDPNKTGTLTKVQTLLFGEAQQTTGHSLAKPCELTFGKVPGWLTGAVDFELSGANAGNPFGAD